MRLKHNKKRNTAFVYEALVRELTESVVKQNKNKQNKIVSIIKEHFKADSALKEELDLYRTIYETKEIEKTLAEKIVLKVKEKHEGFFVSSNLFINRQSRKCEACGCFSLSKSDNLFLNKYSCCQLYSRFFYLALAQPINL